MNRSGLPDIEQRDGMRDGPLSRWQKRKQAVLKERQVLQQQAHRKEALPTDDDMPPVASLTADSDFSDFLSPNVSERLRRLALRKLFHSAAFNVCDGLDDYDGDYTDFAGLGKIVTADMKHQLKMEAQKLKQQQVAADSPESARQEESQVEADRPVSGTGATVVGTNDPSLVDVANSEADLGVMNRHGENVT